MWQTTVDEPVTGPRDFMPPAFDLPPIDPRIAVALLIGSGICFLSIPAGLMHAEFLRRFAETAGQTQSWAACLIMAFWPISALFGPTAAIVLYVFTRRRASLLFLAPTLLFDIATMFLVVPHG